MPDLDLARIRAYISERVPPEVFEHLERTAQFARELAGHHGVDPDKAEAAGLLHDYVRSLSREEIDRAISDIGFPNLNFGDMPDPVVHGPAGALLVERELGIADKQILEAIRLHSTADVEMGDLAKIIFLADYAEEGRGFPGIEADRERCYGDLDKAVLHVLSRKITHLVDAKKPIDQRAWRAYNAFVELLASRPS